MLSASQSICNVRAFAPAPRVAKRTARGPVKVRLRVDARASDAATRQDDYETLPTVGPELGGWTTRARAMTDEILAIGSSAHVLHRRFQSRSLPRDRFCAVEDHRCVRDDDDGSRANARRFIQFLRRARER